MSYEPALQARGGTSHAMETGRMYVKSLLRYTLPFLYAYIVMLPYLSGLSRFTPGDRLTSCNTLSY